MRSLCPLHTPAYDTQVAGVWIFAMEATGWGVELVEELAVFVGEVACGERVTDTPVETPTSQVGGRTDKALDRSPSTSTKAGAQVKM